jgi:hypothetical protein
LLNNRQNGRRRNRSRGPNPGGPRGNESRIDSRARGNAPQLLEKYKNMARDAQLSGDRVMTEYYLQFADHYFRIVAESRARFEEQQQQRRPRDDWREEGYEGEEGDDLPRGSEDGSEDEGDEGQQQPRNANRPRGDRNTDRGERSDGRRRDSRRDSRPREQREDVAEDADYAPVPQGVADGVEPVASGSGIDVAVLPPALGVTADPIPDLDDEPAPTPRKRGRPRKVVAEEAQAEG